MRLEWDPVKNEANLRKHGVTFEDASGVFFDDFALWMADPDHSETEERYLLLGMGRSLRILVVSHSFREQEGTIRVISARPANRAERRHYEQRMRR